MNSRVLFTDILVLPILIFCLNSGLSSVEIIRDSSIQKISQKDIRSFYKNESNKELLEIINFKKGFALAIWESIGAGVPKRYEVFNLETGERNMVYGMNNFIESYRIVDENLFIFHVFGKHSEIAHLDFPFILECHRNPYEYIFNQTRKERYFKLNENVEVGSYPNQKILDVQIFPDGVKIVFELLVNGYAGRGSDIPLTKTEYNEASNEFSIISSDTKVPTNLMDHSSELEQIGYYIKSIQIKQLKSSSVIILKLHKESFYVEFPAKYYAGEIGEQIVLTKGIRPYVRFIFSPEQGLKDKW